MIRYLKEYKPVIQLFWFLGIFFISIFITSFIEVALISICWDIPFSEVSTFIQSNVSAAQFAQAFTQLGIFAFPAFFFCFLFQGNSKVYFQFKRIHNGGFIFLAAILIGVFSSPLISFLQNWNDGFHFPKFLSQTEMYWRNVAQKNEEMLLSFLANSSWKGLLGNIFVMALVPAFCEEIFFRGVLQQLSIQLLKKNHLPIILTAIVFTLFHFEPFSFLPRLFLALLLGYLFYYSKNILVPMLFHFCNNALLVIFYFCYQKGVLSIDPTTSMEFNWWTILISFIITIMALYFVFSKLLMSQRKGQSTF